MDEDTDQIVNVSSAVTAAMSLVRIATVVNGGTVLSVEGEEEWMNTTDGRRGTVELSCR